MNARNRAIAALTGALLAGAAAAAGCASMQVSTERDGSVNLSQYRTFDVKAGEVLENGVVDARNTLVRDRVEAALERGLRQKGLAPDPQQPDLIATYTAGTQDVLDVDYNWTVGAYGALGYGNAWVDERPESALLIDLIDPKTNELVWRSVVEMNDDVLHSPERIAKAVAKALEKYPGA